MGQGDPRGQHQAGLRRVGTATSAFAAAKAALVRPLAAKAWEFAGEAG
jgi:hypothetical protein